MWDSGFGYQDVEAFVRATGDTPYPLLDLTQALSSTVLLQQCMEQRYLELTDRVRRWNSQFAEDNTTVAQLLSHAGASGSFQYNTGRYAALTDGYRSVFKRPVCAADHRRDSQSPRHDEFGAQP